jgi:hypothetical protein
MPFLKVIAEESSISHIREVHTELPGQRRGHQGVAFGALVVRNATLGQFYVQKSHSQMQSVQQVVLSVENPVLSDGSNGKYDPRAKRLGRR